MVTKPPPLPSETLRRVRRIASVNGSVVLFLSALLAVASLAAGDFSGACAGLIIAAAGGIELRGLSLVNAGSPRGSTYLVASQVYLLAVVVGYVLWKLSPTQATGVTQAVTRMFDYPELQAVVKDAGLSQRELSEQIASIYRVALVLVAGLTVLHQGGMALYYHRRRDLVIKAVRIRES